MAQWLTRFDIDTKLIYRTLESKFKTLKDIVFRIIEKRAEAVKVKKKEEEEEEEKKKYPK